MLHLRKFVDIHVALADYKATLMQEAYTVGTPIVRPLMLHFGHDSTARKEVSEFMLGENILMAPIVEHSHDKGRDVYLPGPATWTYLWNGRVYEVGEDGLWLKMFPAPVGSPPVFYRDTSAYKISAVLKPFQYPLHVDQKPPSSTTRQITEDL